VPFGRTEIKSRDSEQRRLVTWLRAQTLALKT